MKSFVLALFVVAISTYLSFAEANESLSLSRQLIVETCDYNGKCHEVASDKEASGSVAIELSTFHKGRVTGVHGQDTLQISSNGVPFKSEIFVNKVKSGYSVYAVLRSGKGTRRNGVTKKTLIETISEFKPVTLTDAPITIDGKEYRAKLIISSVPNVSTNELSCSFVGIKKNEKTVNLGLVTKKFDPKYDFDIEIPKSEIKEWSKFLGSLKLVGSVATPEDGWIGLAVMESSEINSGWACIKLKPKQELILTKTSGEKTLQAYCTVK